MNNVVVQKGCVKSVPLGGGGVITATAGSVNTSDTTGSLIVAVVDTANRAAHISHWAVDNNLDFGSFGSNSGTININDEAGKSVRTRLVKDLITKLLLKSTS